VAEPGLPPQIEPLSFVSPGLLRYVLRALALAAGQVLVDLGCGRGGPGRARIDWPPLLRGAGFAGVEMDIKVFLASGVRDCVAPGGIPALVS
jgi:hypothetical protein